MPTKPPLRDPESMRTFRAAVRRWYRKSGRDLPWRDEADPYRVWIREVMLQQTTVAAVVPYLGRFLAAFPDVASLATASQQDVLKHWEGLGYYSRARNLHRAAQTIAEEHSGKFPRTISELNALPGIGRYTAGAIGSFAFNIAAPIVEANTARLYARLLGLNDEIGTSSSQRQLWDLAAALVPSRTPGRFNQALMDLGATVCTATDPKCDICPIRVHCAAKAEDRVDEIPRQKKKVAITKLTEACVAIRHRGRVLLRQRPENELWAGLWDFPRHELSESAKFTEPFKGWAERPVPSRSLAAFRKDVEEQTGLETSIDCVAGEVRHSVTRFRIRLICVIGTRISGRVSDDDFFRWVKPCELPGIPLTKTAREFANYIGELDH